MACYISTIIIFSLLTMLALIRLTKEHIISTKNNDCTNITILMIAIVHSIYSQSVHAPALNAELMDNDAERYCILASPSKYISKAPILVKAHPVTYYNVSRV